MFVRNAAPFNITLENELERLRLIIAGCCVAGIISLDSAKLPKILVYQIKKGLQTQGTIHVL